MGRNLCQNLTFLPRPQPHRKGRNIFEYEDMQELEYRSMTLKESLSMPFIDPTFVQGFETTYEPL